MIGVTHNEFTGKPIDRFLPPEESPKILDRYRRRLAGENVPSIYETIIQSADGKLVPVEFNVNMATYRGKITTMVFIRDISERKKAEIILRESEDKFRTLAEQIPVGIYRTTEDGQLLYANPALATILGYNSVDELMTTNVRNFYISPLEREKIIESLKLSGNSKINEYQLLRKDGKAIWVRDDWNTHLNAEGKLDYFYGVIENINEQKVANEALIESESNLRAMLNAIPDLLFKFNNQGVYLDIKSSNQNDLIDSKDELVGKSIYDFFPLDFCNRIVFYINKCLATGQLQTLEYTLILNGELNFFEARIVPAGTKEVLTLARNITDRKKSEEKITMLAQTIMNVMECISITDLNNNFIYVNPAFLKTYGFTEDEIIGKPVSIIRHHSVTKVLSDEIFNKTLDSGWAGELMNVRKDGSEFPISLSTAIIRGEKGEAIGFVGVATDITDRKKAEAELLASKLKAEESDRLKTAFLANMSHEIRSPMNAILGFVRLLKEEESLGENGKQYVDLITNSGITLMGVIEDIIDISKIHANQLKLSPREFDLNNLLSELFILFSSQLKIKEIVKTRIHPPILSNPSPFIINSDDLRIKQILTNLISNAIKFTPEGFVKFGYTVVIDDLNPRIQFFVEDTGIGLTPEMHQMIFERFRQADDSYSRMYGGSGLGLAISKGLVDLLGGSIWVESEIKKGSTFYFTLPLKSCLSETKGNVRIKEFNMDSSSPEDWSDKKILVVEDMVDIQFFLKKVFERTRVELFIASSIKEAREHIERNQDINLVLLDIRLPDGDGYDLAREIKSQRPDLPIIAQTAYAMQGEKEKSKLYGCDDYIAKPIDIDLLISLIKKYFG